MPRDLPPWITEAEFAALLGWQPATLVKQRRRGAAPGALAVKQGRSIRYPIDVVLEYFRQMGGESYVQVIIDELTR